MSEVLNFGDGKLRRKDVLRAMKYDIDAYKTVLKGSRPAWRKISETCLEWMLQDANGILDAVKRAEEIVSALPPFERKAELLGLLWRIKLKARYISWKSKVTLDVNAALWPLP